MGPIKYADLELFEHDADEVIIGEASRHSIGVFVIALNSAFILLGLSAILFIAIANQDSIKDTLGLNLTTDLAPILGIAVGALMLLTIVVAGMGIFIYKRNYIVLTSEKLVIARATNIFNRKISQLSIGDVQDVTVLQKTMLSRMFNYGSVGVETAGEYSNFHLKYIALPYDVSRSIVESHEKNLQLYGN